MPVYWNPMPSAWKRLLAHYEAPRHHSDREESDAVLVPPWTHHRGLRTEKLVIVDSVAHLSIELVERYAMRELSDAELARVNKHVASCRECEEWLQVEIAQTAA